MYAADLKHSDKTLEKKLQALYVLNREKTIDIGFRPPFLKLLEAFGNPHLSLPPVIHVAGTNGKGSVIAMLRTTLEAQGKTVNAYTSPHLHHFNERLYVCGTYIDNKNLEVLVDEALALNNGGAVTFFEITTAMAFAAFTRNPADYCLLEVGLGGRLDCTNVVPSPAVTIIANISYDHQEFLGGTLPEIAAEKAGIMKTGVPCITGYQSDEAITAVFEERASAIDAPLYRAGKEWEIEPYGENQMRFIWKKQEFILPRPALTGYHQIQNAGLVLAALFALNETQDITAIENGLQNTRWPARLENVSAFFALPDCDIWYDGGCNDSAGAALAAQARTWRTQDEKDLHLIVGMKGDKDSRKFLDHLRPSGKSLTIIPVPGIPACLQVRDIPGAIAADDITDAVNGICTAHPDTPKRILITGSLYLRQQIGQTISHEQKTKP